MTTPTQDSEPMVVLVLDPDGSRSTIARAVRTAGHRVVTATGIETALIVLGGLVPDLVIVRSVEPIADGRAIARLSNAAPSTPVRVVTSALTLDDLGRSVN